MRAGASARAKSRSLWRAEVKKAVTPGALVTGSVLSLGVLTGSSPIVDSISLPLGIVTSLYVWGSMTHSSRRWKQGADGEARTARVLTSRRLKDWWIVHDRSLPGTKANLDHLAINPNGTVAFNIDTKAWHASGATVRLVGEVLKYGPWTKTDTVDVIRFESRRASETLGIPVVSVMVLDGGTVDRSTHPSGVIAFTRGGSRFFIMEQDHLITFLLANAGLRVPSDGQAVRRATALLPAYKRKVKD